MRAAFDYIEVFFLLHKRTLLCMKFDVSLKQNSCKCFGRKFNFKCSEKRRVSSEKPVEIGIRLSSYSLRLCIIGNLRYFFSLLIHIESGKSRNYCDSYPVNNDVACFYDGITEQIRAISFLICFKCKVFFARRKNCVSFVRQQKKPTYPVITGHAR